MISPFTRLSFGFMPLACGFGLLAASTGLATAAVAATPANRLSAEARLTERAELPQAVPGRIVSSTKLGAVDANTTLDSMTLVLSPTAAQTAALDQLLVDQQDASSASYHKWLTPVQFGERFGVSDGDLQVLKNWLTSQGLQVLDVAASRNSIRFSGTAANVDAAFHAGLQRFQRDGQTFVSNTAAPSLPAAFVGVVGGVQGLSTYRLHSQSKTRLSPAETETSSSCTVTHLLVPYDVRQIYSANGLFGSGYTGAGITIGVIGQTAVNTTQLGYYQKLTGQTVVTPTLTLVPNTGTSTLTAGDEGEAEADIELAGGVAQGATVNFIYTGNGNSDGVFTALTYAVTNNIGSVLTLSYGGCEASQGSSLTTLEPYLRQASAQGQTILNSSGDSGAAACEADTSTKSYDGIAVSYPASSPNVTGVGGTTFAEGAGTYWSTTNNSLDGSALSYIPETVWNESAGTSLAASGGGVSVLFSKPAWQVGTGVPADTFRHVPDVSFSAANGHDGYIFCSADTSITSTSNGVTTTGACTATSRGGYVVGGTSLSTPSFAGMLAIVEQANGGGRLGNINPKLYALAALTPAVFNDVTTGNNQVPCVAGIPGCVNSVLGYAATTGYDQAIGLGSVNVGNLSTAITAATTATLKTPTVTIRNTAITTTSMTFSVSAASISGSAIPTGTVSVSLDGGTATTLTLTSGATATTLTTSGLTAGTHTVTAVYSGDSNYTTASTSYSFTTPSSTPAFTLTASPTTLTVATGATGSTTLTLTSTGYTGLVIYTVAPASGSAVLPGCFTGDSGDYTDNKPTNSNNNYALDSGITAGSTFSAAIRYHAVTTSCSGLAMLTTPSTGIYSASNASPAGSHLPWAAFAFGGFLLGGLSLRRRQALLSTGLLAAAFSVVLFGATGCGSGTAALGTTTTTTTSSSGTTYNYVVTATAYPSGTVTASANLVITVQ